MRNTPLTSLKTACSLPVSELDRATQGWLIDCEIRQHSQATLDLRKIILTNLGWFLASKKLFAAAKQSIQPRRNMALLLVMLDKVTFRL